MKEIISKFVSLLIIIFTFFGCTNSNKNTTNIEVKTSVAKEKPTFDSFTTQKIEAMIKTLDSIKINLSNKGKPVLSACFEGTQNQATITFRENNSFDIFWTGVSIPIQLYYDLYEGSYTEKGDTIFLNYSTQQPARIGNKLLKSNEELIALGKAVDSTDYRIRFFIGECRGLN